jgi:hypothetical protein
VKDAFAAAAAEDGIVLAPTTFDWLCEQGHIGLERVAKARRDPAIVAPVNAALEVLAAIYARLGGDVTVLHAARENLLLASALAAFSANARTTTRCATSRRRRWATRR